MDISNARLEATVKYKESRDKLDKYIRVGGIAFDLLERLVDRPHGDRLLGAMHGSFGPFARSIPSIRAPVQVVQEAIQRSVQLSIVAIHSDFESACRDLLTDTLEFWPSLFSSKTNTGKVPPDSTHPLAKRGWASWVEERSSKTSAGTTFVEGCYEILGIAHEESDMKFVPIFEYFRRCRNRIIHQESTAGKDLAEYSCKKELNDSQSLLTASVRKMAPQLPSFGPGDRIVLEPKHAILFLIISGSIFDSMARRMVASLDDDGFIRMAAYYAYSNVHLLLANHVYRRVEYPARRLLVERYHVSDLSKEDLVERLRHLKLWDSVTKQYNRLYARSPAVANKVRGARPRKGDSLNRGRIKGSKGGK